MIRKISFTLCIIFISAIISYSQSGTFNFNGSVGGAGGDGTVVYQTIGNVTITCSAPNKMTYATTGTSFGGISGSYPKMYSAAASATFSFNKLVNISTMNVIDDVYPTSDKTMIFTPNPMGSNTIKTVTISNTSGATISLNFVEVNSITVTQSGSSDFQFDFDDIVMTNAYSYNVTGLTVGSIITNQIPVSWTNPGVTSGIIILARASSSVQTTIPSVNFSSIPSGNSDFTLAPDAGTSSFGSSGDKLVYKGTGTSVTTTNLTNGTTYYFKVFNWDGTFWSSGSSTSGNQALPVELTSFTALKANNSVNLNWSTATEINNYGFQLERAVILSEAKNLNDEGTSHVLSASWETLGFVQGHGNSNSPKEYSFVDKTPSGGKVQYRLKQIDNDGSFKYYGPVEVTVNVAQFSLKQNYPNPFNPVTTISYSLPQKANVKLNVYDVLGKKVAALVNMNQESGNYNVEFNGSNLNSGIYFYKLTAGNYSEVKKLLLLK